MGTTGAPRERDDLVNDVLDAGRSLGAAAVLYHSTIADHLGLGPTDVKILDILQQEGPLTPKALGETTGFAPASITAIADRLERKGLLERAPHPDDGRRILLQLDPSAFQRMLPLYQPLVESLTEMLTHYTTEQLALLADAFAETARRQLKATHNIPPPA